MEDISPQNDLRMRIHEGLPRQGPGSDLNTQHALHLLPELPKHARIYDMGCGPGRASLAITKVLQRKIISIDLQEEFLRQLRDNAQQQGLSDLIETMCGDMLALNDKPETVDLIWSEGAIYCAGFDRALATWHPLLAKNGLVACSELSWLTAHSSPAPAAFWNANYPAMRSVADNIRSAEQLGYKCIEHYTLPESCWWDEYYSPWLLHLETLKAEEMQNDELGKLIAESEKEIELYRHYNHEYGYEFYVLRKAE